MSMKKMLAVVAAASLAAVAAPAFAANPFSDVPMNHWAYDAVEQLSAKGILEGYPNGTFKGNRAMTRYEIATMVARMMNAGLEGADLEKLKALIVEFQPELEALGVKVDGFDSRLSALEKGVGGWKISGQFRMDYNAWDKEGEDDSDDGFKISRYRLFLHKDLSDGVSFDARWHGGKFDWAYITARDFMGLEGLTVKGGDFELDWEDEDGLYTDNDAFIMDAKYRGFDLKYTRGMFTFEGLIASNRGNDGRIAVKDSAGEKHYEDHGVYNGNSSNEYYGARMRFDFSERFWLSLNALWSNIDNEDVVKKTVTDEKYKTYWAGLGFSFMDGFELKGAYYMQDIDVKAPAVDDPKAWKAILDVNQDVLKFTSLWVEYAQFDKGFNLENTPYSFSNIVWPEISGVLDDDMKAIFVKAKQKWNDKWSTVERYVKYDMDNAKSDAKEWSVAVGYQYSPNLYFELAYADMDGKLTDASYSNNQIRFRTFLTF